MSRRSLVRRLLRTPAEPLALLIAPPGYGKSTLLDQWSEADERPFLRSSDLECPSDLIELIRSAQAQYDAFVIAIDSTDPLGSDAAEIVPVALGELPAGSTIALTSRCEPPLPLGRLRAHRLLTEVRAADLAMSAAEARTLLHREGIELAPEDVEELVRRTEGWPAALYLAALSLRRTSEGLGSFSGQHHLMFEYVNDEVLALLPPGMTRFAARTSMLEEMSAGVCDAVLESRGSALLLRELARLTPLLVPVEPNHHRYRWHTLVREALQSELQSSEPELEPELQRRASAWYAHCGQTSRAIEHAATAGDAELAGDLLSANVMGYVTTGGNRRVEGWLSALGDHRVATYAPLALSASVSCLTAGRVDEAQRWSHAALAALERGRVGPSPESLATGLAVVQAIAGRAGVAAMGRVAAGALESEPRDSQWRPFSLFLKGVSAHLQGQGPAAACILDEAVNLGPRIAPSTTALCLAQRAMIAMEAKDWELAADAADQAVMVLGEWRLTDEPMAALVFAAAAASRAHQGRMDEAKSDVRRGLDGMTTLGDFLPWYGAETRILLAHASLWLADVVGARTLLAEASRLARRTPDAVVFARWFETAWAHMDTLAETRLAGPSSLTIAELRILRFLPSHRSFREIATQLDVSANTVKTQAHAVYRKLGAASRSEAVERAVDAGLLA